MSDELAAAERSLDYDVTDPAHAAAYLLRFKCWAKSDTSKAIRAVCEDHVRMRHDLARALPVVEAAGALVERWTTFGHGERGLIENVSPAVFSESLDALARAYRAAREPRTGEPE